MAVVDLPHGLFCSCLVVNHRLDRPITQLGRSPGPQLVAHVDDFFQSLGHGSNDTHGFVEVSWSNYTNTWPSKV